MEIKQLLQKALVAQEKAYAKYSNFKVGAVIELHDGTLISGCNIENGAYGLCMCAERTALYSLIAQGYDVKKIKNFVVIGKTNQPISPCGACRQVLSEFLTDDVNIILANNAGAYQIYKISQLLPYQFDLDQNRE